VAISVAILVVGSVFLLVGAPLAINSRGFAHHLANWLNGLDDRWYFLPGKPVSSWRASAAWLSASARVGLQEVSCGCSRAATGRLLATCDASAPGTPAAATERGNLEVHHEHYDRDGAMIFGTGCSSG
jgi:hypothetical protein